MEFASDTVRWMQQALLEAEQAAEEGEVPVGCVIVLDGRVIGRGHNRVESLQDPTAHAEMLALTAAASTMESWRLPGAHAYVTVEPCLMCVGALQLARIEAVFYGAEEPKFGACGSIVDAPSIPGWTHKMRVVGGILAGESAEMMREFFKAKRDNGGKGTPDGIETIG